MKKIIIQISDILLLSCVCFWTFEKHNIKVQDYINEKALILFFTAITVLFPIGMSIATRIDLSKVVHKAKRKYFIAEYFSAELNQIGKSFFVFFIVNCLTMFAIVILRQVQVKPEIKIIDWLYIFSTVAIFYSVFYFLYSFVKIFNFKRKLQNYKKNKT